MNNVASNILLIVAIFVTGFVLAYSQSVLLGLAFIMTANLALPTIINLPKLKQATAIGK